MGKKIKRDVIINVLFSIVKAVSMLFIIRISTIYFPPAILGIFLLTRRIGSTGANLFQLGISQTLKRYISINNQNNSKVKYFLMAILALVILVVFFTPLIHLFESNLSNMFFSDTEEIKHIVLLIWYLILGTIVHFMVYSTYMAERKILEANILEFMNVSGFLLLAFYFYKENSLPNEIISIQIIGMFTLSFILIIKYLLQNNMWYVLKDFTKDDITVIFKRYLEYGPVRGLITFFDMLIFLVAPWLIRFDKEEAGYLLIAFTFLKIIQIVIMPISQIASVLTARLLNNNKNEDLIRQGMKLLIGTIVYMSVILLFTIYPWIYELLSLWLGNEAIVTGVFKYTVVILICVLPISIFHGLKGIVEMKWVKPYNLYTLAIAIGMHISAYYILIAFKLNMTTAVTISFLLSIFALGLMTLFWLRKEIKDLKFLRVKSLLFTSVLLLMFNYTIKLIFSDTLYTMLISFILSVFIMCILLLNIFKTPVAKNLYNLLFKRNSQSENIRL